VQTREQEKFSKVDKAMKTDSMKKDKERGKKVY
jgi:hypothetical protein